MEIVEQMKNRITAFNWALNGMCTDATLSMVLGGIREGSIQPLRDCFDLTRVTDESVRAFVEAKVAQFEEVFTIEGLNWHLEESPLADGTDDCTLHISAAVHLVEH